MLKRWKVLGEKSRDNWKKENRDENIYIFRILSRIFKR